MAGVAAENTDEKKPAELRDWVHKLMYGGAIPLVDFPHCSSSGWWASPPGDSFLVRGPLYFTTQAKVPAGQWLLQPLAFDWLQSSSKLSNIMQHPDCRVRVALEAALKTRTTLWQADAETGPAMDKLGDEEPFVWAFNMQVCNKENHSLVVYYVSFHSPSEESLLQRFLDGDEAFRSSRLKMIMRVAEGPQIVKAVARARFSVCRVGKLLKCTYTREKHYIEVDVDMGSSIFMRSAVKLALGFLPSLVVDLAFVLEGLEPNELPERILGAMRFAKVNLSSAIYMDAPSFPNENKAKP